jgi:hypothetical protein
MDAMVVFPEILRFVKHCANLKELTVRTSGISDEQAHCLSRALLERQCLKELVIIAYQPPQNLGAALALCIKDNPLRTLRSLEISVQLASVDD